MTYPHARIPHGLANPIAVAVACTALLLGCGRDDERPRRGRGPVPVEVADITVGAIALQRTYTGSVRAQESFVVAANVAGRVRRLLVDLSDPVERGQVVAELDDDEDVQEVSQAAAELAVARANLAAAQSALVIATRERDRIAGLHGRDVLAAADLDRANAAHLAATSAVEVAEAQVTRTIASLRSARIRSNYNKVIAAWTGDDLTRVIAQRSVNEGDRVVAGQPIFTVVDLEPILVVVNVGEQQYAKLRVGQSAIITTRAYADQEFLGTVKRIAPVFRESSRQAQVEIELANERRLLKPGMFVRARIELERAEDATVVPVAALTTRDRQAGVFVVAATGDQVTWRPVTVGIRQDRLVQVTSETPLTGRVVVLGHQLIGDGSKITIPDADDRGDSGTSAEPRGAAKRGGAS